MQLFLRIHLRREPGEKKKAMQQELLVSNIWVKNFHRGAYTQNM
jgi:hypothetical protein